MLLAIGGVIRREDGRCRVVKGGVHFVLGGGELNIIVISVVHRSVDVNVSLCSSPAGSLAHGDVFSEGKVRFVG